MNTFEELITGWEKREDVASDSAELLRLHSCGHTAAHSARVAKEAGRLAARFGVNPHAAKIAGYLHDISAIYPNHQRLAIAQRLGIDILPEEEAFPMIIHQKISKEMATSLFDIQDSVILSAIECHTTLRANPSKLDLVLFVADKIEWDQAGTPPYLTHLNTELDKSLEHAAFAYLSYMWAQKDQLQVLHPWLKDAYTWLSTRL